MDPEYDLDEREVKDAEYLILLILGKANGKISILHLHKIFFFLWKFHPQVRRLVDFIPHLKGPYSPDLKELMENPIYVTECWEYLAPKTSEAEKAKGGYLEITAKGKGLYKKIVTGLGKKAEKDEDASALISAVDLIVPFYTRLEWDELLFLLYTDKTNKEYSRRSELYRKILRNSNKIIKKLIQKGIVPKEKKKSLIERAKTAS